MKTYFQFRQELNEKTNLASTAAAGITALGILGGGIHAANRYLDKKYGNQEQPVAKQVETKPVEPQFQQQAQQQPKAATSERKEEIDIPGISKAILDYESAGAKQEKISRPFKDHKGKLTIGHGHLIGDHSEGVFQRAFPHEHKKDSEFGKKVLAGQQPLSSSQMMQLMHHDISTRIPQLHKMIPTFHKLPTYLQHQLASEHYRGGLGLAKKTVAHINAGRFHDAAHEYLDSDEYRKEKPEQTGVATRYDNLHKALLQYHQETKGK
jgi:GH24 family phage-related lysozyme (muramidase)